MIINPLTFRIDKFIVSIAVFKVVPLFIIVSIEAAILEWALAFAFVKHAARYFPKCCLVLLTEVLLVASSCMIVRWNDKVAGLTADGARAEVMLGRALIVGCTPRSNTLQAENVITAVKHTKLAP